MFWKSARIPEIASERLRFLKSRPYKFLWKRMGQCWKCHWHTNDIRSPEMLDWKQKAFVRWVWKNTQRRWRKREQSQFRKDDYYSCSKVPPSQQSHLYPGMGICVCTGAGVSARACTPAINCVSSLKFDDSTRTVKRPSCPLASQ